MNLVGLKKKLDQPLSGRRMMIDVNNKQMSIRRHCELLGTSASSYYYKPAMESLFNPDLMEKMGLETLFPKRNLSKANAQHKKYPYLLKGLSINHTCQVWSTDITYIRLSKGFAYLVAVIDWFSHYVLSWELSNSLDSRFCIEALEQALQKGTPIIFNSDQGSQFTSDDFTKVLEDKRIKISMDGKNRALDNIFVERLWRSLKYEEVYCHAYENMLEAYQGISKYFEFYNNLRPHQSLNYQTPHKIHYGNIQKIKITPSRELDSHQKAIGEIFKPSPATT